MYHMITMSSGSSAAKRMAIAMFLIIIDVPGMSIEAGHTQARRAGGGLCRVQPKVREAARLL